MAPDLSHHRWHEKVLLIAGQPRAAIGLTRHANAERSAMRENLLRRQKVKENRNCRTNEDNLSVSGLGHRLMGGWDW
jgi:hypothetical protein